MEEKLLTWHAEENAAPEKTGAWYWTVGIAAGGVAVASIILGNILLALIAVVGAFTIMLSGSRRASKKTCAISEKGVHIGPDVIPFTNITRFAIDENEPRKLALQTTGLIGTTALSLGTTDFRSVRSELKNRNIEEVEFSELDSFADKLAEMIGM